MFVIPGCGSKFTALIVSDKFEGVALLERQRMVHAVLEAEMKIIHALSLKCMTPAQAVKKGILAAEGGEEAKAAT